MRVALVTTPQSQASGIGDYTQALGRRLAKRVELLPFVPDGAEGESWCGLEAQGVRSLTPRSADRILYQFGNERAHAFMLEPLRRLGGIVTLHDWILFDLAAAAYPELERGDWRGHVAAWRCGGLDQRRRWHEAIRARRAGAVPAPREGDGPLLHGWHDHEEEGRWTASRAGLRLPAGTQRVTLDLYVPEGHRLTLRQGANLLADTCEGQLELELDPGQEASVALGVRGVRAQGEDPRELGVFVHAIHADGQSVALDARPLLPVQGPQLSDARFELPFQRPVVRWADAFFVHSSRVGNLILDDRNAATPIGLIPHGVQPEGCDPEVRAAARQRLGWDQPGTLLVSFGAIQDHKRPIPLLEGFAAARAANPSLRLVLAGAVRTEQVDLEAHLRRLGLDGVVEITGWLEEGTATDWMRAADFCVHLRGPSSLGTSGGAARALGVGRALVLSDLPEWAEFPDGAVLRVPHGEDEADGLAQAFLQLAGEPGRLRAMEREADRWAREEADWEVVADRTVELLDRMPVHRSRRRSLIQTLNKEASKQAALRAERAAESSKGSSQSDSGQKGG